MEPFEAVKLRIKDAVDIVGLIEDHHVVLKPRGRMMVGLCPFHQEKTPSFTVYPETQHYHCYGCKQSGDVFSFLMEREGISFREAMETLADQKGISTEGIFGGGDRNRKRKVDFSAVLSQVAEWFGRVLESPDGALARAYLEERGMLDAVETFGVGAHPTQPGALKRFAAMRKLPSDILEEAGLLGRGGRHEPMLGRVVFPIQDERGRVVGFGGRVLPQFDTADRPQAKYRNSPESPFFNKRRVLYGLRQAKDQGNRKVIVVEGYTDVIACHLAGFGGAVATLGTALTSDHARMLERYATDGIVLLFDGDNAGRQAAERAFKELVHTSLPTKIALLPDGCDPADLITVRPGVDEEEAGIGRQRLQEIIDSASDAVTMFFRLLRKRIDLSTDVGVQRAATECGKILESLESRARREALIRDMAGHLRISEAAIREAIPQRRGKPESAGEARAPASPPQPSRPSAAVQAEFELLGCLLVEPERVLQLNTEERANDPSLLVLVGWIREAVASGRKEKGEITKELFARCGENSEIRSFLTESCDRATRIRDVESIFSTLVRDRLHQFAREEVRQLRIQMQQAIADGDQSLANKLTLQYMDRVRDISSQGG